MVDNGLAISVGHVNQQILDEVDAGEMNNAARKVVGTNVSARREILFLLAGIKNSYNHYIIRLADILDRVLRATHSAAQGSARTFMEAKYGKTD